ncbi:MAG: tetratricopeptide repeat protein [Acidobacteria bacterium]|nr:tetratricopeptide repeat protein [Acidobacteriota bacterium]
MSNARGALAARTSLAAAKAAALQAVVCSAQALACAAVLGVSPAAAQTLPPAEPSLHLVVPFENATGEPRVYWLSEGAAVILSDDLRALGVAAITRDDRRRAFDRLRVPAVTGLSHATVIRLGQMVGASQVTVGAFELQRDDLVVRARTIELGTGRISPELVERGPLEDLFAVYGRVARRIVPDSPVSADEMEQVHPPLPAFEQYIKGVLAAGADAQVGFLTQALRLYPAFHRARIALWGVHHEAGEHLAALAIVRQVPATHRLGRQARFLAALSFLQLGQYQEAFNAFAELHAAMPDPALLNNIGVVQLRVPDSALGSASDHFRQAVAMDESDSDLFFNLGYAYWRAGEVENAVEWLREAVRRNPADDAAHYVLGVALQTSGHSAEAGREKELARQLSSVYAEWEARQGGSNAAPPGLERLKTDIDVPASLRVDAAVVAAEQRDQRAVADFHFERGRRFFDEERDVEALAELRRTVFLAPYDSEAHLLIGRIYLRLGRVPDAIDALKIAVWSDPANAEARALLDTLR